MADKVEGADAAFLEAMERDFEHVIAEMSGDQSIARFRRQFQNLYEKLKESHEKERLILQKCKELNNNISMGLSYIRNSESLTRKDAQNIQMLANELDRARSVITRAQEKEEKDKKRIEHLQMVLRELTQVIKESEGVQSGKSSEINKLSQDARMLQQEKEEIDRECEVLRVKSASLSEELKAISNAQAGLETDLRKENNILKETKDKIKKDEERKAKQKEELARTQQEKDKILKEKEAIQKDINDRQTRIDMIKNQVDDLDKLIATEEKDKEHLRSINEQLSLDIKVIKNANTSSLEYQIHLDEKIKILNGRVVGVNMDLSRIRREKEKVIGNIQLARNVRDEAEKTAGVLNNQLYELQREIEHTDKRGDKDQGLVDNLLRDQNTIKKNFLAVVNENKEQHKDLEKKNETCEVMKKELKDYQKIVTKRGQHIRDLEIEKEAFIKEAKLAVKKYLHLSEEIKLKDNLISEIQKKTQETESRLKIQQQLYEAVRSDRNLYSKNLTETQDEIAEIKLRYKIVQHQISQLKEEIDAKEKALNKQYYEAKDKEKVYQKLKKENESLKSEIENGKQNIMNLKNQIGKSQSTLKESESSRLKLKQKYEDVVSQRDVRGTLLIRRNDELALIYEKIKMQLNTLANGEAEYRERIADIEILDNTIRDLTRELAIYKRRAGELGKFYQEINEISKELIEEKLKVKGLSEELENPKNRYRWRNLEGSDCDTNELISKIESLQKRLIAKTEEVVAKDLVINTQEQTIKNLDQVMSTQPGLAEAEQISYYQQLIKSKTRKLKALAAELNMYQAQSNEFKYEIEKLTADVDQHKKSLYDIRRREQLMLEQEARERRTAERGEEENIQML